MSTHAEQRRQKISNIKLSLQTIPVIKKTTLDIEAKLQKQNKKNSYTADALFNHDFAESVSETSSDEETD